MDGKWESTRDVRLIAELHRAHNPGLFDLGGQYSHLRPRDLSPSRYRCWIHRSGGRTAGFAVSRVTAKVVFFEELWCQGRGMADMNVVGWDPGDTARLAGAHALVRGVGRSEGKGALLRVTDENTFGLLLAKRYELPLENSLLLATRNPGTLSPVGLAPGYAVRPFQPGDEGAFAAIHNRCFNQDESVSAFRQWVAKGACEPFSVTARGRVVGFIIAEVRRGGGIGDFNLAIDEGHRHRGLGTALLGAALDSFGDRGVEKVVADHWALNGPAVAFYRRHGFSLERAYHYFRLA